MAGCMIWRDTCGIRDRNRKKKGFAVIWHGCSANQTVEPGAKLMARICHGFRVGGLFSAEEFVLGRACG